MIIDKYPASLWRRYVHRGRHHRRSRIVLSLLAALAAAVAVYA